LNGCLNRKIIKGTKTISVTTSWVIFISPKLQPFALSSLVEKSLFDELNIPVAPYRAVDSLDSLKQAVADLGLPIVLKPVTGG